MLQNGPFRRPISVEVNTTGFNDYDSRDIDGISQIL